jgi:uncharacterized RDD family membrane protein YckC
VGRAVEHGIVTPEAVRLDFDEASVGSRAVAIVLDWMIQLAVLLFASFAAGLLLDRAGAGMPPWVGVTVIALLSFVVLFGYPIGFETLMRGRTPGKAAMGLRVLTTEGAPVGFRHASIRAALGLVDFGMTSGFVGVITALVSRRSQRVGDHLAGTVVIRERTGAGAVAATAFAVPHGYEGYASTIDPAGLRGEDYRAVRAFLMRAQDLAPDRRAAIGRRLADSVAARLAHRIPPEVHPEAFLLCVAARYQHRTGHAARREAAPGLPVNDSGAAAAPAAARTADAPHAATRPRQRPEPEREDEREDERGPEPVESGDAAPRGRGFAAPG